MPNRARRVHLNSDNRHHQASSAPGRHCHDLPHISGLKLGPVQSHLPARSPRRPIAQPDIRHHRRKRRRAITRTQLQLRLLSLKINLLQNHTAPDYPVPRSSSYASSLHLRPRSAPSVRTTARLSDEARQCSGRVRVVRPMFSRNFPLHCNLVHRLVRTCTETLTSAEFVDSKFGHQIANPLMNPGPTT